VLQVTKTECSGNSVSNIKGQPSIEASREKGSRLTEHEEMLWFCDEHVYPQEREGERTISISTQSFGDAMIDASVPGHNREVV